MLDIGNIGLMDVIAIIALFIAGYMLGSGIKSGAKYAMILIIFIFALFTFGILGKEVIQRISEGIGLLKPIIEVFKEVNILNQKSSSSVFLMSFLSGVVIGFVRG